jgi:uncharacterized protein (TIGR03000 family)
MASFGKYGRQAMTLCLALLAAGLLLAASTAPAGGPPWGKPSGWPWDQRPKIHGYDERPPATPPPANVTRSPVRYTITITVLPQSGTQGETNTAWITAHLPEDALLWIQDYQTKQRGMLRHYESPALTPGAKYHYTARLVWFEDGQWVSETKKLPVSAGAISCLFLTKKNAIRDALAELSPEHRKLAEQQQFCPIQPANQLGAMGTPIKVMLKGQPVFLCCKDCVEKAQGNPDQTLAKVKELKAKNARTPPQ